MEEMKRKKVFVSGCYDMLHSGHVAFFKEASSYGDLYVGIGSDETILHYKGRKTVYSEQERLYMVKAIRYVTDAYINAGSGIMDFVETLEMVKPDVFVVNHDGANSEKEALCKKLGIEYVVLDRKPDEGLKARSTTSLRKEGSMLPTRLDLAGTWIDQPYVSEFAPGWALTISLEPTFDIQERGGLSTSTRNMMKKIWPVQLPDGDPETLAKLAFCFENDPIKRQQGGHISGAQDALGICMPGLCRQYYNRSFWPEKLESCHDREILDWLESHLCLIFMFSRRSNVSVTANSAFERNRKGELTYAEVGRMVTDLTRAADDCWKAILDKNLAAFASAYRDSFHAQVALFPAMMQPGVQDCIDRYAADGQVMAWKMAGAGGGGYLILVVNDREAFCANHPEAICPVIRRRDY
ncbi:hypothetical protein JCM16496A_14470 [Bacteroides rodentium JCM 16496]